MINIKKSIFAVFAAATLVFCIAATLFARNYANAETIDKASETEIAQSSGDEQITPYGWFADVSIALYGGDGYVRATAKNEFTLFPSTVRVSVYLYCSDTYQDSYENMTLAGHNSISDLDMGKTIEARSSTDGEQKYWKARVYYKVDSKDWADKVTGTYLCNAQGNAV